MKLLIIEAMLTRFEFGLTGPPPFAFTPLPAAPFSGPVGFPVAGYCELGAANAELPELFWTAAAPAAAAGIVVVLGVCDLGD